MPRTLLVVCCTALAAGAGGVLSGLLPLPPGVPSSVVVAGSPEGPAGGGPVATLAPGTRGTPTDSHGAAPAPNDGTISNSTSRPSLMPLASASTSSAPSPSHSASASPSPSAHPSTPVPKPSDTTAVSIAPANVPAPTGSATAAMAAAENEVLNLVNVQRADNGCGAVTYSASMTTLAQNFSAEMAQRNFFDHTDPDGKTPWDRAAALGITNLGGENIAMGQQTPQDVMTAWMNSPGHRANILDCSYHTLGVGVYYSSSGGPWWTQDFGF